MSHKERNDHETADPSRLRPCLGLLTAPLAQAGLVPHAYIPTGEGAEVLIIDAATQQTVGRLGGLGMMRLSGALRDTVHVPPMSMITIAFDAGEAAPWVLHCHHMGHLQSGMMTELAVSA